MAYELAGRLVIGIASSALFDLAESDEVYRREGVEAYRRYQEEHLDEALAPGVAFAFIRRLLSMNDLAAPEDPLVEVIVLSRNNADTGLRVMRSIRHHELAVTRAVFTEGQAPYRFIPAFNMSLFLSANADDVAEAIALGLPAGRVIGPAADEEPGGDLRIAFDFDGVLADDESERVYQTKGLAAFLEYETANAVTAHNPGPLRDLLAGLNRIQQREQERQLESPGYLPRVRIAIVTARHAPAHERAVRSLKAWGVTVNDAFFLGGIDKGTVMAALRPHIFFDDQAGHIESTSPFVPSVHVPFGLAAQPASDTGRASPVVGG